MGYCTPATGLSCGTETGYGSEGTSALLRLRLPLPWFSSSPPPAHPPALSPSFPPSLPPALPPLTLLPPSIVPPSRIQSSLYQEGGVLLILRWPVGALIFPPPIYPSLTPSPFSPLARAPCLLPLTAFRCVCVQQRSTTRCWASALCLTSATTFSA
eukprot:823003-Rhodomonas_salina.1